VDVCVGQSLGVRHVFSVPLYRSMREEEKKRREIGLDAVYEANAEMSVSSGDKISGRDRDSIGFVHFYIHFIQNITRKTT
jgi:hypothetical protein